MKSRPGRNPYELLLVQSARNLQKNDSYAFNSERNLFSTSSQWPLAYVLLLLAIFWCHLVNFPSEKSILPYFSSPRGVATLDCEFHSQAGSTSRGLTDLHVLCCLCWMCHNDWPWEASDTCPTTFILLQLLRAYLTVCIFILILILAIYPSAFLSYLTAWLVVVIDSWLACF